VREILLMTLGKEELTGVLRAFSCSDLETRWGRVSSLDALAHRRERSQELLGSCNDILWRGERWGAAERTAQ
jgi:hypothetical protein